MFFLILCFWLSVLLAPSHSAEVLPSVPNHEKVVVRLREKIGVLHRLPPGVSSSTDGQEFSYDSTIYIK